MLKHYSDSSGIVGKMVIFGMMEKHCDLTPILLRPRCDHGDVTVFLLRTNENRSKTPWNRSMNERRRSAV